MNQETFRSQEHQAHETVRTRDGEQVLLAQLSALGEGDEGDARRQVAARLLLLVCAPVP